MHFLSIIKTEKKTMMKIDHGNKCFILAKFGEVAIFRIIIM